MPSIPPTGRVRPRSRRSASALLNVRFCSVSDLPSDATADLLGYQRHRLQRPKAAKSRLRHLANAPRRSAGTPAPPPTAAPTRRRKISTLIERRALLLRLRMSRLELSPPARSASRPSSSSPSPTSRSKRGSASTYIHCDLTTHILAEPRLLYFHSHRISCPSWNRGEQGRSPSSRVTTDCGTRFELLVSKA